MPQETNFSIAAVWLPIYNDLLGTPWESEDLDNAVNGRNHDIISAARALQHVYRLEWKGVEAEDGVLATIRAAEIHYGGNYLTASQVKTMAANFAIHYPNIIEPAENYLDENCGPVGWHWLNQHGRQQIREAIMRPEEIWLEGRVNVSDDVWVFNKPTAT